MISNKYKFIFLHIPKTGGNSIQKILFKYSEDNPFIADSVRHDGVEDFEVRRVGTTLTKHSTLQEYYACLGPKDFSEFFKFTCIRNSWDRILSHYFYNCKIVHIKRGIKVSTENSQHSDHHFFQFIDRIKPVEFYLDIEQNNDYNKSFGHIDYFLRFDDLADDFKVLLSKLDLPIEPLVHLNKTNHKHYRNYYSDRTREKVRERFKREIEYFNFEY